MKKIITAKEQWTNAMNDLRNKGYDCDKVCEDLGAINENECYHFYNKRYNVFFTKVGDIYEQISFDQISPEYLLADSWKELNPDDDWYDKGAVMAFLLSREHGCFDEPCPIAMCDLVWMRIYSDDESYVTQFEDKEVEVSAEEIEAIRKEIVERCKGHSIEEVRDMFDGYNWGEYGEDTFDFTYKGFVFCVENQCDDCNPNEPYSLLLSTCVYSEDGEERESVGSTITLPIPPKEIKLDSRNIVDEKPDLSKYKSFTAISYDHIVERMRESCIGLISDIYHEIDEKFIMLDLSEWRKNNERCYFAEYDEGYKCALTKNDNGDVVIAGRYNNDFHPDDWYIGKNWSFVSVEEMLYIINQLTSK